MPKDKDLMTNAFYVADEKMKSITDSNLGEKFYTRNNKHKKTNDSILILLAIMAPAFLQKYWIDQFNHSLPPSPLGREQD